MVTVPLPSRGAHVQIGDFVPRAGIYTNPGVVMEKKENGDLVVNTDPNAIKQFHRHSVTNGLTPEDKERFNVIMDEVMSLKSNPDRINTLQTFVDDLKADSDSKKVTNALKTEQAQLIRMSKELPRVYVTSPDKIK